MRQQSFPFAAVLLFVPLWAIAQSPQPEAQEPTESDPSLSFPGQVEQVVVDVVVTDGDGNPVRGLLPENLQVFEDGKQQEVVTFDAFDVTLETESGLQADADAAAESFFPMISTNAMEEKERHGRTFVIVFDDLHFTPANAIRAREAVKQFIREETHEGDRVTLLSTGGAVWWSGRMLSGRDQLIKIADNLGGGRPPDTAPDRMSDYEAMMIHVNRDVAIMNRVQRRFETFGVVTGTFQGQHIRTLSPREDPVITTRAAEVYFGAAARNRGSLGAIERALDALVPVEGRKSVVLVSDGFIYDKLLNEFDDVFQASRRANAAIYFISGLGLEGITLTMDAEFSSALPQEDMGAGIAMAFETQGGSESLAQETGGFTIKNSNDLAAGFERISDESRSYYLIGYNPTNTARDGGYRDIDVKIRGRKGLKVRARRGYYAPSDDPSAQRRAGSVFQRALDSPYDRDGVGLRMTHVIREETLMGKARVFLASEIDIAGVEFEDAGNGLGAATLDLLLVATNGDTGESFRQDQTMDLKLLPDSRERLERTWLPFVRDFDLPSGSYQARLIARDKNAEELGTVTHEFEVPELGSFRVSTPVISDIRETTPEGLPGDRLAILARREFPVGGTVYCQVDVYGAATEEDTGMPDVAMGYEVRSEDGTVVSREPLDPITPTSLGVVSRLVGFAVDGAGPGNYELILNVQDTIAGEHLKLREPFRLSAPLAGNLETPAPASGAPAR